MRRLLPILTLSSGLLAGEASSTELVLAREIRIDSLSGDTSVTEMKYDARGYKVREILGDSIVSDWDEIGRYLGTRKAGDTAYFDRTVWVAVDSTWRDLPGLPEPVRDRYFGLRMNCWCADSMYHYLADGTLIQKRLFTYDGIGHLETVRLVWMLVDPTRADTVLARRNVYDENGRLISSVEVNREAGEWTRTILYEYEEYAKQVVERPGLSALQKDPRSGGRRRLSGVGRLYQVHQFQWFDVLGRRLPERGLPGRP